MENNALHAISPIDGRYSNQAEVLAPYFSEMGLIKYRVFVEIEYFIALCEIPLPQLSAIDPSIFEKLREIHTSFSETDALAIKALEKTTNHDVKAVEYFLKENFDALGLGQYKEFIHFGLTSQDINNTAIPASFRDALENVYLPMLEELREKLHDMGMAWKDVAMLARTHGQPASPTRLGKEIQIFSDRIWQIEDGLDELYITAKFGGATGNFNAHHVAYPAINWVEFADEFVNNRLGLFRNRLTTQIDTYDSLAAWFDAMKRVNTVFLDLCKDMWSYISMEYFKQQTKAGEVGSSAMPHKVNPIDFENAEGNLGIANALFEHLAAKLPISRLQRDLTDSTVLRNIGVPIAHTLIAFNSIQKGLGKLLLNQEALNRDLDNNWAVVAEGIQTILRRENYPQPYEALKELTRGKASITEQDIKTFVSTLKVSDEVKKELNAITPHNYTGIDLLS